MKSKINPFLSSLILNALAPDALRLPGRLAITLSCGFAALITSQSALADNANWTGGSLADANWGNTGNWSVTPVPGTGNTATFNAAIANTWGDAVANPIVIDDMVGQSIKSITFTAAAGSYFLGSPDGNKLKLEDTGAITITNALTNPASAVVTETINAPLELQGTAYSFINSSPNGTAAKAGILSIGGAVSGVNAAATVLTLSGNNTNANTLSGTVSNGTAPSLGIIKIGSGTWLLSGPNTFSGPVSVQQGNLSVNSIADSGTSALGFGALNLGNLTTNGTLTYTADVATTTNRAITLTGSTGGATINTAPSGTTAATSTLTFNGTFTTGDGGNKLVTFAGGNAGANTVSSLLANATDGSTLTVVKNGSGTWTLTNANTFTGPLFLNQGFLTVNSIADGGVPCNLGAGTSIRLGNAASPGILRYTGGTQSTNRTIQLGNNSATPAATDIGGGIIQNDGAGLLTFSAPTFNTALDAATGVGANRILTLRGLNDGKITGIIQDNTKSGTATGTTTIGVTKEGAGTWTLEGANSCSGPMVVSDGTLTISGSRNVNVGPITVGGTPAVSSVLNLNNPGTYGTGQIVLGSGGATSSTINQSAGAITSVGGAGLIMGNNPTATNSTYALSGGALTAATIIMGTNAATTGTHVTNFNLSDTGALTVMTLRIGRNDGSSAAYNSDNTFTQTGGTATVTSLNLGGRAADTATAGPIVAKLTLTGGTFSATTFASLSAGGAAAPENANTSTITIGGTAQVTLPAFPTVRGTNSTATLTFDGGTLIPAAASATYLSGLTNAFITANGANLEVPATKDITIAQVLENAPSEVGSLTKSGAGILVLSGANTYTGNTTVLDGTLEISNTYLADSSTLTIGTVAASPAVLNLPNAGTDTVAALVIDGVTQTSGLYHSTNSGGAITGLGKIQVGASANTYANWLTANAPATGFSTDTDNDGVPNGVENVLGTNPNTSSPGLTQVSSTPSSVTFQHTLNPTIASDVSYTYQWSSDLIEWQASGVANTADTIGTILPSTPVAGVVTVTTTQSGTTSSTLFTRIQAENP